MRDEEQDKRMAVATTILSQLGGHKFVVMTGARDMMALDNGLRFRLPGGAGFCRQGINLVRITLEDSDTYSVAFQRVRGQTVKTISEHVDIYDDGLRALFTAETGLDTHL